MNCLTLLFITMAIVLATPACRADQRWTLAAVQFPENCLAERKAVCVFQLTGASAKPVRIQWQVMFERGVWDRGSLRVTTIANRPVEVTFDFRAPPVVAGVIAGGKLQLQVNDEQETELVSHEYSLWVFHEDPFATEFAWLKELQVRLIDPDQKLTGRLRELNFPGKVETDKHQDNRVLLVAQLKTWDAGTTSQIQRALRDGWRVLCLATEDGQLKLDKPKHVVDKATDSRELPEVHAANADFVRQLDPRLSANQLTPLGRCRLVQEPDERIMLTMQKSGTGWWFIEAGIESVPHVSNNKSAFAAMKLTNRPQLVYCGANLMSRWDESPTSRYLLARLLERMCFKAELPSALKDKP